MELVLPMYNAHPYFSLKNLAKNCTLYTAKYGSLCIYEVEGFVCLFAYF